MLKNVEFERQRHLKVCDVLVDVLNINEHDSRALAVKVRNIKYHLNMLKDTQFEKYIDKFSYELKVLLESYHEMHKEQRNFILR